jgi:predicted nucleic acid-binding protein
LSLYAESSAVLSWLMDEPLSAKVRAALKTADLIVSSDLTLIECDRVLWRAIALRELTEAEAADRRARLVSAASHWQVLRMSPEIIDRARAPFPGDPIRTLDAIHLASALVARASISRLELLTLDDRIRGAAKKLGLNVVPESA